MPAFNEEIYRLIENGNLDVATEVYAAINTITITTRNFGHVQRNMAKLLDDQYGTRLKQIISSAQTKSSLLAAAASLVSIFAIIFALAFLLDGVQSGSRILVNLVVGAVATAIIVVVTTIYRRFKAKVYSENMAKLRNEIMKIRMASRA